MFSLALGLSVYCKCLSFVMFIGIGTRRLKTSKTRDLHHEVFNIVAVFHFPVLPVVSLVHSMLCKQAILSGKPVACSHYSGQNS